MPKQAKPRNMQFTPRDRAILEAVYIHDGLLSEQQIQRLFFTGVNIRTVRERLMLLVQHGYLARPDIKQRAQLDEPVYWLERRGAQYVADLQNVQLSELNWRRPGMRFRETEHDLKINDFRLAVTEAIAVEPELELGEWIPSRVFWSRTDRIEFAYQVQVGNEEQTRKETRGVRPDGYFSITQPGFKPSRFLVEIDMGTEDHPRFAREKLHSGLAYIQSPAYKQRFGHNAGRWLVVTTTPRRRQNMQDVAQRELGDKAVAYFFTTLAAVSAETVLRGEIWYQGAATKPTALAAFLELPRRSAKRS